MAADTEESIAGLTGATPLPPHCTASALGRTSPGWSPSSQPTPPATGSTARSSAPRRHHL